LIAAILLFHCLPARSQTANGSILGTVKDATGAVVPNGSVVLRDVDKGTQQTVQTNSDGAYVFPSLPLGHYEIGVTVPGFRPYRRTGLTIDVGTKLQADVTLEIGEQSEELTVSDTGIHVETESSQMGDVLDSVKITEVPLNGRAFTDLLNLQPGVIPVSTGQQNQIIMAGLTNTPPSGDANPGNQSINGQKENANGFVVNGSNVEEAVNMGVAVLPNLDSISEFRILTNNFDAEYGNYSGGQIIVATKSGTNQLHGTAFDFVRNTVFDATPFFSLERPRFDQNQFGGAVGGPIKHDKLFWYADYQGSRTTQGLDTGVQSVPSLADHSGNLSDLASSLTGAVSTTYLANVLTNELGYTVSRNEPYYNPGCASTGVNACVFPGAVIPKSAWSAPAAFLMPYFPSPNIGTSQFDSASLNQAVRDDKGGVRVDANTRWGNLSGYYFAQFYGASSVNGSVGNPAFGQIVGVAPPRVLQMGAKFFF